jgi:hypothetical protein
MQWVISNPFRVEVKCFCHSHIACGVIRIEPFQGLKNIIGNEPGEIIVYNPLEMKLS